MNRRELIVLLGGAAVSWPRAVSAQPAAMPVIGYLASASADQPSGPIEALYLGLRQAGYEVGQKVRFEYRYANNQLERLPALAKELVELSPDLIIASGGPASALAAKAATATIPIVFTPLSDPVRVGLVASFNRPGGNITGIAALTVELEPKRLELLNELRPSKGPFGVLFNPTRPDSQLQLETIKSASQALGRELVWVPASNAREAEEAFKILAGHSVVGVLVAADPFFSAQRRHIVSLMANHGWPAVYQWREFVDAGGLASFGSNLFDSYRQAGLFAARVLKGEKPADLPVQQPTKVEFVLNLKTARSLGLSVSPALLARADDVIE